MAEAAPVLHAGRLQLRPARREDATQIAELASDLDIARMTTRMPHPYTLADAEAFIERAVHKDPKRDVTFVIDDGSGPVGALGLFTDDGPWPELGYWIGRPVWGRGYATEATETALGWAERSWGKRAVTAGYFEDNPASRRVLEKTGFLPTGVTENRWSLARGGDAPTRLMVRLL